MTANNRPPDHAESPAAPASAVGRFRWVILGVLFCATTINYMDRFLLGVLKPTIVQDLHWTETDYANVVFCFQLAYAIGLDHGEPGDGSLGVRWGMALVVGMCAIAAASHSLVSSVMGFCLARFALGIGESGCWPGCAKTVSEWFPRKERAIGMGVVNAGSSVGATITPLVVPLILKLVAWPFVFLFTAALDVIWLCVWLLGYRSPDNHPWLKKSELAYIRSDPNPPQGRSLLAPTVSSPSDVGVPARQGIERSDLVVLSVLGAGVPGEAIQPHHGQCGGVRSGDGACP